MNFLDAAYQASNYAFAFVVMLGVLIFVHELGHFMAAKACGIRVLKFSLGFGSPVGIGRFRMRWVRGHTEYVVGWIPLGGFVKMLGETPDPETASELAAHPTETLDSKPLWQKLIVIFAGAGNEFAAARGDLHREFSRWDFRNPIRSSGKSRPTHPRPSRACGRTTA